MAVFSSCASYVRFEHVVCRKLRYVRPKDIEEFLQTVLATARKREQVLKGGTLLWRAQSGYTDRLSSKSADLEVYVPGPHPPDRMEPFADRALEGRASPKGIPVLYLSIERDTALTEMRPALRSTISVARFAVVKDLRIIDCSFDSAGTPLWPQYWVVNGNEADLSLMMAEPSPDERERSVWTDIDIAFAKPIDRSDYLASYAPTQIIAELFKSEGYDGIKYRSALRETGHNVALFDLGAAKVDPTSCALFEATKIDFEFREIT